MKPYVLFGYVCTALTMIFIFFRDDIMAAGNKGVYIIVGELALIYVLGCVCSGREEKGKAKKDERLFQDIKKFTTSILVEYIFYLKTRNNDTKVEGVTDAIMDDTTPETNNDESVK